MKDKLALASFAVLFAGCFPAAPRSCCSEPSAAVRMPAAQLSEASDRTVKFRDIFEFRSPGADWIAITNARVLEFSPPAAMLLGNDKTKALIRFHLVDSEAATPGEIVLRFIDQFDAAGYKWQIVHLGEGREGSASVVWEDNQRPLKGKITVMRLPGKAEWTMLLIGLWPSGADEAMVRDFDAVSGSLRAPSK